MRTDGEQTPHLDLDVSTHKDMPIMTQAILTHNREDRYYPPLFIVSFVYSFDGKETTRMYDMYSESDMDHMRRTLQWCYHKGIEAKVRPIKIKAR